MLFLSPSIAFLLSLGHVPSADHADDLSRLPDEDNEQVSSGIALTIGQVFTVFALQDERIVVNDLFCLLWCDAVAGDMLHIPIIPLKAGCFQNMPLECVK